MMNIFYLLIIILGVSGQNIIKKPYTNKTDGKGVYLFSAMVSLTALLFFAATSMELHFSVQLLPYAVAFAIVYGMSTVFTVLSVSSGSLSLTSLIVSYSLLIPTFYGILFLKDSVSVGLIIGIVLLVLSILLINKKEEEGAFSWKWLVYVSLAFVGNGMCTVVQKMQQQAFHGQCKNEFMILALALVTVCMLGFAFRYEKECVKLCVTKGWFYGACCGILNGIVNLLVMILSGRMAVSVMFPLMSAGGMILTYLVSRFIYKETLTKVQFIGFLIGIVSVVFLNI